MGSFIEESSDGGYIAPFQTTLFLTLLLAAVVGNGLVFFLFIRNKTLRTVHYAFFADLSIIDLLNSLPVVVVKHLPGLRRFCTHFYPCFRSPPWHYKWSTDI